MSAQTEVINTRIGKLEFTHDFANGYPTKETVEKLYDERDFQRACQVYLWAFPMVSWGGLEGLFRSGQDAAYGDLMLLETYSELSRVLTPNATTPYAFTWLNLGENGPYVIEVPIGPTAGVVDDLWQRPVTDMGLPGPDAGKGGKYLLLGPGQEVRPNEHKPSLKEKAVFQFKEFFGMFLYVWVLLALFDIHQSIILAQEHINYQAQGFAIINALILAKVLLIGEDLHLAREFEHKPLAYSILYKSLVFSVFLIGFHIVEEVVIGLIRGRSIAQSFPAAGGGSVQAILSRGTIEFVALIPFFAFREIGRVIGKSELWSLLLTRGTRVYTLQSRPQQ